MVTGKFYVWKGNYSIIKSRKRFDRCFAVIEDKNEMTCIINNAGIKGAMAKYIIKEDKNWKIITFDMVMKFNVVGFLARISKALADEKISIFAISAYSRDHILVKAGSAEKAIKTLERLGYKFER